MAMSADTIIGLGAYAPGGLLAAAARLASRGPVVQPRRLEHPGPTAADVPGRCAPGRAVPVAAARRELGALDRVHVDRRHDGVRAHGGLGRHAGHRRVSRSRSRSRSPSSRRPPASSDRRQPAGRRASHSSTAASQRSGASICGTCPTLGSRRIVPVGPHPQRGLGVAERHEPVRAPVDHERRALDGPEDPSNEVASPPSAISDLRRLEERRPGVLVGLMPDELLDVQLDELRVDDRRGVRRDDPQAELDGALGLEAACTRWRESPFADVRDLVQTEAEQHDRRRYEPLTHGKTEFDSTRASTFAGSSAASSIEIATAHRVADEHDRPAAGDLVDEARHDPAEVAHAAAPPGSRRPAEPGEVEREHASVRSPVSARRRAMRASDPPRPWTSTNVRPGGPVPLT